MVLRSIAFNAEYQLEHFQSICNHYLNSIVAGQVSGSDCSGGIGLASLDHNIESGTSCGLVEPGDQQNVAPTQLNLGPLQGNGGPIETHAPGAGSVAIDAIPNGACTLTEDQQGVLRPVPTDGVCDAGAVETIGLVSGLSINGDELQLAWDSADMDGFAIWVSTNPYGGYVLQADHGANTNYTMPIDPNGTIYIEVRGYIDGGTQYIYPQLGVYSFSIEPGG